MAYTDQAKDPRERATAIAGVAIVHTALAALLLGMTIAGAEKIKEVWDPPTFTKPTPTPTPPPTPIDPANTRVRPTPPGPVPPIEIDPSERTDNTRIDDFDETSTGTGPTVFPTPTPQPSPSFMPRAASPSNDKASWITNDDYPARALRDEEEGTVGYRLIVSSSGRVSACEITRSSGNGQLDAASCRLITRRARFEAATDESGASVVGSYSGTVRWHIPD